MKLKAFTFILYIFSWATFAKDVTWVNVGKLKTQDAEAQLVEAMKTWSNSRFDSSYDVIRFEFSITEIDSNYLVLVTPIFKGEVVEIDGQYCIAISKSNHIISSKQCVAP